MHARRPPMAERRVLIAEDDPSIRNLLQILLARNGVQSDVAADGTEALRALESGHYCLVVLDLMMPKMSGYEVITALKEWEEGRRPDLVLVTTAGKSELTELDETIVTAVVSKPFDIHDLGDVVRDLVNAPESACRKQGHPEPR